MDPMAVPTYDLMMRPLLELAAQQDITWRAAELSMRTHLHVTEEEMALLTPTGQIGLVRNRTGWAMICLKKAGLLANVAPITYRTRSASSSLLKHQGIRAHLRRRTLRPARSRPLKPATA